jgi:O-acetylserine/cysteine efflux transporter
MRPFDVLLSLVMVSLWGFVFVFAKAGATHFSPFLMVFFRFLITALCLVWFFPKPPMRMIELIKLAFIFSVLHIGTFILAMSWGLDASIAGIIDPLTIAFSMLLGVFVLKESVDKKTTWGIAIAFVGALSLFSAPNGVENPGALVLMIVSTFMFSFYSIQLKRLEYGNILALLTWLSIISLPMTLVISLMVEDNHIEQVTSAPPIVWFAICYLGIASAILGHGIWGYLIKHNPVFKVAPILLLVPVISAVAGCFFYNELITTEVIIGMCLMIFGVGIVLIRKPKVTEPDVGIG